MITVRNITKKYDYIPVLHDVSFSLEKGQRIALVGPNGVGKTTLLRILARQVEPDLGEIATHPGLRIAYVPQDMVAVGRKTVRAYIDTGAGYAVPQYMIETMLAGFEMATVALTTPISHLSGGQKRKVALIAVLLSKSDLFLFDEPTNDLDMATRMWLENYIVRKKLTAIIVSHDRVFLDTVATRVLALDPQTRSATMVRGKYSDYMVAVEKQTARMQREYTAQRIEIDRLEKLVKDKQHKAKMGAQWQGTDNDKILRGFKRNRAAKSGRVAQITVRRIERIDRMDPPKQKISLVIPLESVDEKGAVDISLTKVCVAHGTHTTKPITLSIPYGSRIGFVGPNGVGKTTILRMITGMQDIVSGTIVRGSSVRIGVLTQDHTHLPTRMSPLSFMKKQTDMRESAVYNLLKKFGIDEIQAKQPIGVLSPGSKTRLLLALCSAQSVNVLVLDEPTNHLDIEAVEALENLLETYTGTVILVSHDRALLEHAQLQTVYLVEEGVLSKIKSYTEYVEQSEDNARSLMRMM